MTRYNGKVVIVSIGPGRGSGFLVAKAPFPYNPNEWYFLSTLADYDLHESQAKKAQQEFEQSKRIRLEHALINMSRELREASNGCLYFTMYREDRGRGGRVEKLYLTVDGDELPWR